MQLLSHLTPNLFFNKNQFEALQDSRKELENSIKTNNSSTIAQILQSDEQRTLLAEPLHNGLFPLHFAILEGNPNLVQLLLSSGAKPEDKDGQGLNAIDHAALIKNKEILAILLSHLIHKNLNEIQTQIQQENLPWHTHQLKARLQQISDVNLLNLNPVSKAAFEGNTEGLGHVSKELLEQLDANGFAPLHYAVLGGQIDALKYMKDAGADLNIQTGKGDTLLHLAVIESGTTWNYLKNFFQDCNPKNHQEQTPLHYAAALERFRLIKELVQLGADLKAIDHQGLSPLALMGMNAYQKDPLAFTKNEALFCITSLIYWFSRAIVKDFVPSTQLELTFLLLLVISIFSSSWFESAILFENSNDKWSISDKCMFYILNFLPFAHLMPRTACTLVVCESALKKLKECWSTSASYRPFRATSSALVHSANIASTLSYLALSCIFIYDVVKDNYLART